MRTPEETAFQISILSFLCTNLHFCYGFDLCQGTFHHFHVCRRKGAISYLVVSFGVSFYCKSALGNENKLTN